MLRSRRVRALLLLTIVLGSTARAEPRQTFVVSAAPPLDAERLAEVLRVYLDEYNVDVRTAPAPPAAELRNELGETRAMGEGVRALATVRIADASSGSVEILFVDHFAGKALVATIQRAPRDEDFYRSLALKIQNLLRSALYERADELAVKVPALARLVAPPTPAPVAAVVSAPPAVPRHRLSLEVAYALETFPAGKLVQQGVSIRGRVELARIWELALGIDALAPLQATRSDVTAQLSTVPILLSGGLHLRRRRVEGAVGAVGEILVVALDATSPTTPVRSDRHVSPALGAELSGRVRLAAPLWLYARGSCLGVFLGERYTIRNQTVFDWSRVQVSAEVGLGVAVW